MATKRPLRDLSRKEYDGLREMGMLWEFYPEASGDYDEDHRCRAQQFSDEMQCPCGLTWDVNDPDPPKCR